MGCGSTLVKYILFITNLVFALAGLAILGLGIAAQLQITAITNLVQSNFEVAPIFAMVVGGIVFIISFFGCCGAIRESNCMLLTYAVFLALLMIIKIALSSYIFVNLSSLQTEVPKLLEPVFNATNLQNFYDLQEQFHCCGTTGPQSYATINVPLPPSCCPGTANNATCLLPNAYEGCNGIITSLIYSFAQAIAILVICVASVQLLAVIFGCCLANNIRNKDRRSRY